MIARETVCLLEMGFNVQNAKWSSLVPKGSKDQHGGDGEEKGEGKLIPTRIISEDTDGLINVDLSREQKISSDLEEIEKLKLEISSNIHIMLALLITIYLTLHTGKLYVQTLIIRMSTLLFLGDTIKALHCH